MTRTTLITGGASGIGLRLGELLAARGDDLVILDRTLDQTALDRLRAAGPGRVEAFEVDVRDAQAVRDAVAQAPTPRLLINSAGIQLGKRFGDLTEEEFRRVIDVNLIGSRNVAVAVWDGLRDGGHLVLVASLAGLVANYGYAAYCASKFGVVGLAEVLRIEGRPEGITVSCVCPPEVDTPMVEEERRTELAPTRDMKQLVGTMDVDTAAQSILAGIDARRFLIIPGRRAQGARQLARFLPGRLTHAVSDRTVARALR